MICGTFFHACKRCFVGTRLIGHAASVDNAGALHSGEIAGCHKGVAEFLYRVAHRAFMGIHLLGCACGERDNKLLSLKLAASSAVTPAVLEDLFHPTLHERRSGIPEHGKLEHDYISGFELSLLGGNINLKAIAIELVKIIDCHLRSIFLDAFKDAFVCHRVAKVGVARYDEYVFHGWFLFALAIFLMGSLRLRAGSIRIEHHAANRRQRVNGYQLVCRELEVENIDVLFHALNMSGFR